MLAVPFRPMGTLPRRGGADVGLVPRARGRRNTPKLPPYGLAQRVALVE